MPDRKAIPDTQAELTVLDRRGNLIKPYRAFDKNAAIMMIDIKKTAEQNFKNEIKANRLRRHLEMEQGALKKAVKRE